MAFPALAPTSRRYTFGVVPVTEEPSLSGGAVRFLHGSDRTNVQLELGYDYITADQAKLLRDHYRDNQGGLGSFSLSAAAWAGHTSQYDLLPSGTLWCWADPPTEEQLSGGLVKVSCKLRSVLDVVV